MNTEQVRSIILDDTRKLLGYVKESEEPEAIVRLLWEIAIDRTDREEQKRVRKAAKKALYTLRSDGIEVDKLRPGRGHAGHVGGHAGHVGGHVGGHVTPESEPKKAVEQAILSLPDSKGDSILIISATNPKTLSLDIHQFLMERGGSVQDYKDLRMSKHSFERFKGVNKDYFPLPASYAFFRLQRALKLTAHEKQKKMPQWIKERKMGEEEHPVVGLFTTHISNIMPPSQEKGLFSEREIVRITLPPDEVEPYREEIAAAKKSRLILDNRNPEQRVEDIIGRFCMSFFTDEQRQRYRDLLYDLALYYYYQDKKGYSRILLEYGGRMMNRSADLMSHPFVQFLIYREFLQGG